MFRKMIIAVIALMAFAFAFPSFLRVNAASISASASCSLADAITAANSDTATGGCSAGSGADTILITADVTLTSSLPAITSDITVQSDHATTKRTISGNDQRRIFQVNAGASLTINRLILRDGRADDGNHKSDGVSGVHQGGAIRAKGTISNFVNLVISNSEIRDSLAIQGGGIFHDYGNLTVSNSVFSGNQSGKGGAIMHPNWGSITISGSQFMNNAVQTALNGRDPSGGAIMIGLARTTTTISGSVFSGNNGLQRGGAIAAYMQSRTMTLKGNTFYNNSADKGGGLHYYGAGLVAENNTFVGNSATIEGGGISLGGYLPMTLTNNTIVNNSSADGGGVYRYRRSDYVQAHWTLRNNIISGNTGGDCKGTLPNTIGRNFIGDNTCNASFSGEPHLGAMQTTAFGHRYFPLVAGSSQAINTGEAAHCPSTDQIGATRPIGSACDLGAIENKSGTGAGTPTVTPTPLPTETPTATATATNTPLARRYHGERDLQPGECDNGGQYGHGGWWLPSWQWRGYDLDLGRHHALVSAAGDHVRSYDQERQRRDEAHHQRGRPCAHLQDHRHQQRVAEQSDHDKRQSAGG